MTGGCLPRAFRDVCHQIILAAQEGLLLLCISVRFYVHLTADGKWDSARSTPAPICGASGDLPVGPQQNEFIVRSVAMYREMVRNCCAARARKPEDV